MSRPRVLRPWGCPKSGEGHGSRFNTSSGWCTRTTSFWFCDSLSLRGHHLCTSGTRFILTQGLLITCFAKFPGLSNTRRAAHNIVSQKRQHIDDPFSTLTIPGIGWLRCVIHPACSRTVWLGAHLPPLPSPPLSSVHE